jgi:predicted nicotinamide N-methyase
VSAAALATDLQRRLQRTIPEARIEAQALPLAPELALYLLANDYPRGPLPREAMRVIMEAPAYWAFCWASGQVLARWLLDTPGLVRGRHVLDFGSGSGVAGIAAARAGAASVTACDLDPDARAATAANARLHGLDIEVLAELELTTARYDVVLLADVLYDFTNLPLLRQLTHVAPLILIADSRVRSSALEGPLDGVVTVALMEASTIPDLDESPEFRHVCIYRWDRHAPPAPGAPSKPSPQLRPA